MSESNMDRWVADELAKLRKDLSGEIAEVGRKVERLGEWRKQQDRATRDNGESIRAITDRLTMLEVASSKSWMNFLSMLIAAMISMAPVVIAVWRMLKVVERAAGS